MRNRFTSFWGRRATLVLRVPLVRSIFPEAYPHWTGPGVAGDFDGTWYRRDHDHIVVTNIAQVFTDSDQLPKQAQLPQRQPYGWSWWECTEMLCALPAAEDRLPFGEVQRECRLGDASLIPGYVAQQQWINRYVHGDVGSDEEWERLPALLRALLSVGRWAKTTYEQVDREHVYYQWSVEWFYPGRRRGFCAALRTALRLVRRERVPVRIVGDVPHGGAMRNMLREIYRTP